MAGDLVALARDTECSGSPVRVENPASEAMHFGSRFSLDIWRMDLAPVGENPAEYTYELERQRNTSDQHI